MNTLELLKKAGIETSLESLPDTLGISLRADTVQKGDIFIALKGLHVYTNKQSIIVFCPDFTPVF